MAYCDRCGVAGRAQGDCTVLCQWEAYRGRVLGEIEVFAVGLEKASLAALLDSNAADVSMDVARVAVVLERDLERVRHLQVGLPEAIREWAIQNGCWIGM